MIDDLAAWVRERFRGTSMTPASLLYVSTSGPFGVMVTTSTDPKLQSSI